ncbi:tripartite tricarboxylate transporter TctB family protein [Ancylobacter amanitiformis]|uniref:Tricarboxylic transport membrane protein n=1 Tax=Ancylobacter amanitiformis TaxID=217069 RepID=A0ABU0LW65_9HYPH|nr:tripartite tricarboxylate transporter TctB family protein [Ancylobacter amanitiformis]MDQ0512928.1 putative tricarboxylic transport membrane protein [Ancylobacter amanitiformis]
MRTNMGTETPSAVRSPSDLAGSLFLFFVAGIALWQADGLTFGTLEAVGPGFMPISLAVLLAGLAALLFVSSLRRNGEALAAWSLRPLVFVLGAFIVFGLALRPLGLSVAGPLAVILAGFASNETRFFETAAFGIAMTAACIGLFKYALNLPIPLAPWLLGY